MRVVIALGGNAMTGPDGSAEPGAQIDAVRQAAGPIADLVVAGNEVVLTHGNGPQVGNLLVKNEIAARVVPPVPLDWCGAQTQATIGFILMDALDAALADRGLEPKVATVVSRTRVDPADPAFDRPTKPIGRYLPRAEAERLLTHGQQWEDRGERGWRRVVASPEPLEVLDAPAVEALLSTGFVVVANGGGGVPVVREKDGSLRGVEAVIDKDLGAALLGRLVKARVLVVATDVESVYVDWGQPGQRALGQVSAAELRGYAEADHFAAGSMGPKVEAACRFVESGGERAVVTSLTSLADGVHGRAGTVVVPVP